MIKGEYNLRINSWKGEIRGKKEKGEEEHIFIQDNNSSARRTLWGPWEVQKKKNAGGPVFLLEDEVEDDM